MEEAMQKYYERFGDYFTNITYSSEEDVIRDIEECLRTGKPQKLDPDAIY